MNYLNHTLNPIPAIASTNMAGGLMKNHPWKKNWTARKTCKIHASTFISIPPIGWWNDIQAMRIPRQVGINRPASPAPTLPQADFAGGLWTFLTESAVFG